MIRPAKFSDTPAIEQLLRRSHKRSKYAGRTTLNDKALNQTVMGMIAGQNQHGPQATHVTVCEHQGKVVGFMAATLNRVYGIGEKLVATDVFIVNEGSQPADTKRMIDAYIAWASANPKVIEIGLSWSDTILGGHRMAKVYRRRGFVPVGEQYELRIDILRGEYQQGEAA